MFPSGFIDRNKKADKAVFAGPAINKMKQQHTDCERVFANGVTNIINFDDI